MRSREGSQCGGFSYKQTNKQIFCGPSRGHDKVMAREVERPRQKKMFAMHVRSITITTSWVEFAMMMIAFITFKSSLVPLLEGL